MQVDGQNDSRKEYVIQCVIAVLNIPRSEFRSNSQSNASLEQFLDDANIKMLQAIEIADANDKASGKRTVMLSTELITDYSKISA